MDEREVRALLTRAADSVEATDDLAARAQRRYRRRRARGRALAVGVVLLVVGVGVATAAAVGGDHTSTPPVVEPTPSSVVTPTSRPDSPQVRIDGRSLNALSFVDANVGYGMDGSALWRTEDGGSRWEWVGVLPGREPGAGSGLHFETATDGVAWGGDGRIRFTTDGGQSWRDTAVIGSEVASWSDGRLWAIRACYDGSTCPPRPLAISDDRGARWSETASLPAGFGWAAVVATSRSTAYVAGTDMSVGRSQLAVTHDGGASWSYEATPCEHSAPELAYNGTTLLLVCILQPTVSRDYEVYTSDDEGGTWSPVLPQPVRGTLDALSNVGSTFVAGTRRGLWSSADGRSWTQSTFEEEAYWAIVTVPEVGAWARGPAGLLFSRDGARWEPVARPPTSTTRPPRRPTIDPSALSSLSFVDADNGFAVRGNDLVRSRDGGRTWTVVDAAGFLPADGLHFETESDGLAWGREGVDFTRDGGRHWSPASTASLQVLSWSDGRVWAYKPCPTEARRCPRPLYASDDLGETWVPATTFEPGYSGPSLTAPDRSTAYVIEGASADEFAPLSVKVTHDGGTTWTSRAVPCDGGEDRFVASNGRSILVGCPQVPGRPSKWLLRSTDDGASWERLQWPFDWLHFETVVSSAFGYIGYQGSYGTYVSTDDGETWHAPELPNEVAADGGVALYPSPGIGIWGQVFSGDAERAGIWFSPDGVQWEARMRPRS
jgi:photosystem II stability/assembly factor-like uncharacterized protein